MGNKRDTILKVKTGKQLVSRYSNMLLMKKTHCNDGQLRKQIINTAIETCCATCLLE